MTLPIADLRARAEAHGIHIAAGAAGVTFTSSNAVFRRRWILGDDRTVAADMRSVSILCADTAALAVGVAGHLAEIGASRLWLLPDGRGSSQGEAAAGAWRDAVIAAGGDATVPILDDGSVALELRAGQVVLPRVIAALLTMQRRAWLIADGPLVTTIAPGQQVWMDSPDPRLLPPLPLAE